MKSLLKLTIAITVAATLGSASLFAGSVFRFPTANEIPPPRLLVTPVRGMTCSTMVIKAGGRNGLQVVSCADYATIRPDDCRRACAK